MPSASNPAFRLDRTGRFSVISPASAPRPAPPAPLAPAAAAPAPAPAPASRQAAPAAAPAATAAAPAAQPAGPAKGTPAAGAKMDVLTRRMFVVPSFELYGGVKGFYDLGPPGCGLKANLLELWRRHFILEESMQEVECTALTPEPVLRASGHVAKFTDLMVRDTETGQCYRADKLLEDHIEGLATRTAEDDRAFREADALSPEELDAALKRYGIRAPETGNALTAPFPFNLMFETQIGPQGGSRGFLRPETAQGIFVNFPRLLACNNGRVPFAAAQIGNGFRNEISPRGGLLRVREFQMAEIEQFVHPEDKAHAKFSSVARDVLTLFANDRDAPVDLPVGAAVAQGMINNETLGYYMARTQRFCTALGLDRARTRFRQHLQTEMAHYATDCWDLEVEIDGSWVECAGHADRACYDLMMHAKATGTEMVASVRFDEPQLRQVATFAGDKRLIGKTFKKAQKAVLAHLESLPFADAMALEARLAADGEAAVELPDGGGSHTLTRAMGAFSASEKLVHQEKFTPHVIEPSFGVGRLLAALMDHAFYVRAEDEQRAVMAFRPAVAPFKFGIFPLSTNAAFEPLVARLRAELTAEGCACRVDASGTSIGRRYARADELGIPFAVTVDFDSAADDSVTLRERDSCQQVRIPADHLVDIAFDLCCENMAWADVKRRYLSPEEATVLKVEDTGRGRFTRPR